MENQLRKTPNTLTHCAPKATWEAESRVKEHFAESLKEFKTRKKSGNDPADYKQVKINDKN